MNVPSYLEETMRTQYLQPGETPELMVRRVVDFVTEGERKYGAGDEEIKEKADRYYADINNGYWIPSSPFLMNAGTNTPMLFACFVQGVEDTMESIFDTLKRAAIIHKYGGGTGFDFSPLRAKGSPIKSTGGESSGVLSFLNIFNEESEGVRQGGKRRAANMAALRIDHPEIIDFINAKKDKTKFNNFNFSALASDNFMKAVKDNADYPLLDNNGTLMGIVNAGEVYDTIIRNNWESGEPGLIFIDTVNKSNPIAHLGEITATNPCGEEPLLPDEACDLASIDLSRMVVDGLLDTEKLIQVCRDATDFLDTAIDVNMYPLPEIEEAVHRTRKIGVGVMGLHGALIKMGLCYDSEEGREEAENIMTLINITVLTRSHALAMDKGVPSGWYGSYWESEGYELRNLGRLTIAPTGTISMINDSPSSGAEPIFALVAIRNIKGTKHLIINPLFEEVARKEGWYSEELMEKVANNRGRATGIPEIPERWQNLFKVAEEITPEGHVRMQAVLQTKVDASISKTINMPNESTIEDLKRIYMLGWSLGCKGLTIYRSGSREGVLVAGNSKEEEPKQETEPIVSISLDAKSMRPEILLGVTTKIQSGCGKLWITINPYKGHIWEVFASSGADGGCTSNIQEIARLASLLFREGISADKIVDQLRSVKCPVAIANKNCDVKSCSDAIAKQIVSFLKLYSKVAPIWDGLLDSTIEASKPGSKLIYSDKVKSVISEYHKDPGGCETCGICSKTTEEQEELDFLAEASKMSGCRSGKCM